MWLLLLPLKLRYMLLCTALVGLGICAGWAWNSPDRISLLAVPIVFFGFFSVVGLRDFFQRRPELTEPVGLPLPQACDRLRAAGFICGEVRQTPRGKEVMCEAFEETAIDGKVIRVRLSLDEAGNVCDTQTRFPAEWFDAERCLLPGPGDSPGWYGVKCLLFPVRLAGRYTAIALLLPLAIAYQ